MVSTTVVMQGLQNCQFRTVTVQKFICHNLTHLTPGLHAYIPRKCCLFCCLCTYVHFFVYQNLESTHTPHYGKSSLLSLIDRPLPPSICFKTFLSSFSTVFGDFRYFFLVKFIISTTWGADWEKNNALRQFLPRIYISNISFIRYVPGFSTGIDR